VLAPRHSPNSGKDWTRDRSGARNLRNQRASWRQRRSGRDETRNAREKHK